MFGSTCLSVGSFLIPIPSNFCSIGIISIYIVFKRFSLKCRIVIGL
uniref:Uncharacterized protein n=1 Tax=virus sp. ctML55 TaxID=2827627 RepID=A0A8S5RIQ3_9VIRU|nr:MAG TPA: hypothetical protein [virus sp. ctML55]